MATTSEITLESKSTSPSWTYPPSDLPTVETFEFEKHCHSLKQTNISIDTQIIRNGIIINHWLRIRDFDNTAVPLYIPNVLLVLISEYSLSPFIPKALIDGQLVLKYSVKQRRKPQSVVLTVVMSTIANDSDDIDNLCDTPSIIVWGTRDSQQMVWSDIEFVAHGLYSPAFKKRSNELDSQLCVSIVGPQIIDVLFDNAEMATFWVTALRRALFHSDDESDHKSQLLYDKPVTNSNTETTEEQEDRRERLIQLQRDLFLMTHTTYIRNVGIVDTSLPTDLSAETLYERALREEIPWRQWNQWISDVITSSGVDFTTPTDRPIDPWSGSDPGYNPTPAMWAPELETEGQDSPKDPKDCLIM